MINPAFTLRLHNSRAAWLDWTVADAALESWIFVDGLRLYGPMPLGTLDRSVTIPMIGDTCQAIEVHDMPADEPAESIYDPDNRRPIIQWNPVATAERYRLYHQVGDEDERCILDRPARSFTATAPIRQECPMDLDGIGGVWHFLRVEAVDQYGNESTRLAWRLYVMQPPAIPSAISIVDGSAPGLFNLTITP